jgi:hypothetical protein
MDTNNWQVADLTQQELQKIKQLEPQIKSNSGKEIVLIAYQKIS